LWRGAAIAFGQAGTGDQRCLRFLTKTSRSLLSSLSHFDKDGWIFELKYDGFRALAAKSGLTLTLTSRHGNELARAFPEITKELATLQDCVLDGELVVVDARGIADFDALAKRSRLSRLSAIMSAAQSVNAD
jgi:bifunctional non-homologous end joining protein LigD